MDFQAVNLKLTEQAIADLTCEPGRKDRLVFDDVLPGLAVRVSAGGAKAFLAQYTFAGSKRRVPIGRWGAISLHQARVGARSILGDVAKGMDPAALKTAARVEAKSAAKADKLTLELLLSEWEKLSLSARRESYRREALRAMKLAYAGLLQQPAGTLTRDDALIPLDRLVKAGKSPIAGRTLAYGRACYRWALRRGMVAVNPFDGLPIAAGAVSRDRVLSAEELVAVWRNLPGLGGAVRIPAAAARADRTTPGGSRRHAMVRAGGRSNHVDNPERAGEEREGARGASGAGRTGHPSGRQARRPIGPGVHHHGRDARVRLSPGRKIGWTWP